MPGYGVLSLWSPVEFKCRTLNPLGAAEHTAFSLVNYLSGGWQMKKCQVANIKISINCYKGHGHMLFLGWLVYRWTGLFISYYANTTTTLVCTTSQQAKGLLTNPDKLANMDSWLNQGFEMAVSNVQHLKGGTWQNGSKHLTDDVAIS